MSLLRSADTSMPWRAATAGLAVIVVTPFSSAESRSAVARAWTRSDCPAFPVRSSDSFSRAGPGLPPIALSRAASAGEKGTTRLVNWPSEAALELSANQPVALTRSKLPAPSSVTLSSWPIFHCSSDSFAGE